MSSAYNVLAAAAPAASSLADVIPGLQYAEENNGTRWISNQTSSVENYDWVLIGSTVLLSLTILGALFILGSMAWLEYRGRPSTTRTRLVQSLVVSDLILGIVGLIGSAIELGPSKLEPHTATCSGLGFSLVAVLWTEHLWTLTLAFGTYMILIYPLHRVTTLLETHWIWLWAIVWVLAIVVALIGYFLYDYSPSGGICYYGSSAGLYGELIQFIPRAIVFVCITFLYARLFVFLRRPDKIRSPYSDPPTGGSYINQSTPHGGGGGKVRRLSNFLRRFSGDKGGAPGTATGHQAQATDAPMQDGAGRQPDMQENKVGLERRPTNLVIPNLPTGPGLGLPSSQPISPTSEIPPWERVELPVFQVDGQRYGGASANLPTSATSGHGGMWGNWKGLSGRGGPEQRKRPSTASSSSPPQFAVGRFGSVGEVPFNAHSGNPNSPQLSSRARLQSMDQDSRRGSASATRSRQASADQNSNVYVDNNGPTQIIDRARKGSKQSVEFPYSSFAGSNNQTQLHTPQDPTDVELVDIRRGSDIPPSDGSRRSSATIGQKSPALTIVPRSDPMVQPSLSERNSSDLERSPGDRGEIGSRTARDEHEDEDEEEEEDGELDLLRMLRGGPGGGGTDVHRDYGEGEVELVPESMASYLNRKTSLLMLWFPLGYILLFSISLIRIIYDFASQPPTVLRALSRWFIFAQGLLDAIIYGLVEWHTKRVVRKRVRRGALSPRGGSRGTGTNNSFTNSGIGNVIRSINFRRSQPGSTTPKPGQLQSQTDSLNQARQQSSQIKRSGHARHGSLSQSQTGSYLSRGDGYPSILQELELEVDVDTPRKGSVATTTTASTAATEGGVRARDYI